MDGDAYFLEVCRYVDLNPVRAGMVKRPEDWTWSSHCAHTSLTVAPAWLDSATLHRQLAPRTPRRDGPARYANFVAQGCGVNLWDGALTAQIYLGSAEFMQRMQAFTSDPDAKEVPRAQRRPASRPLQWYFDRHGRNAAIVRAFVDGDYTQTAIAEKAGLSVSRISRVIKMEEAKDKTEGSG